MKLYQLVAVMVFFPVVSQAYDTSGLYINFKRVGFDLGTAKVSNYREYEGSPNTEINQNTQGVLKVFLILLLSMNNLSIVGITVFMPNTERAKSTETRGENHIQKMRINCC